MTMDKFEKPRWADTTPPDPLNPFFVEPADAIKDAGWLSEQAPPYQYMNWLHYAGYEWVDHLDQYLDIDFSIHSGSTAVVAWNGSQLSFSANLQFLFTKEATTYTNRILVAGSPITLADGEMLVAILDDSATTVDLALIAYGSIDAGYYSITNALTANDTDRELVIFKRVGTSLYDFLNGKIYPTGTTTFLSYQLPTIWPNAAHFTSSLSVSENQKLGLDIGLTNYLICTDAIDGTIMLFAAGNDVWLADDDNKFFAIADDYQFRCTNTTSYAEFYGGIASDLNKPVYFDGGSDTYINSPSSDVLDIYVGGLKTITMIEGSIDVTIFGTGTTHDIYITTENIAICSGWGQNVDGYDLWINYYGYAGGLTRYRDFKVGDGKGVECFSIAGSTKHASFAANASVPSGSGFYFDGGSNTYIYESAADTLNVTCGGVSLMNFVEGTYDYVEVTAPHGLLLPDIDPPLANYANRNGIVKAWVGYDDIAASIIDSYNIDSVSGDDGDGDFAILWDIDFVSSDYIMVGSAIKHSIGADGWILDVTSTNATYGYVFLTNDAGTAGDNSFNVMAMGNQ